MRLAFAKPLSGRTSAHERDSPYEPELRRASLDLALFGAVAAAGLVIVGRDPSLTADVLPPGKVALCLLGSALLAFALRARWCTAAAIVLVVGLAGSLVVALDVFRPDSTIRWLSVLVLVGAALFGSRGALAVGLAASALLGFALPALSIAVSDEAVGGSHAMTWAVVALAWLVMRPVHTSLGWAWHSYEQAQARTAEAQQHRGELARTLKELNEACYRLEVANAELSRARQAADEARQFKARFAALVSHELRLPLNIITGFSEMMVMSPASYDDQALPPAYRTDVEAIHRASYHLSNLIDDVLDLSEIDAHKMTIDKEWLPLADVVADAAATASGLFQSKALSLSVDLPADLPSVYADRTRVKQVVLNLLKNAARFTDAGGATVSAAVRENDVVVAVADTGIGIAPQDVPHVFEEFRQVETGGQRRVGGSGLGLTISKQFVELHGGTMWLESRPGWGTTFCFSLPLCTNVAAATMRDPWETWARPQPVAGPDTAPSVAVIGHDQHTLRLLQHALDTYRLVPVTEPAELGRLRAEGLVEAAVVVESPDRTERRALRNAVAELPSLVTIGCAFHTRRSEAIKSLGVVDYLAKPVDRGSVARALASLHAVERVLVVDDDPDMARLLASMVASLPAGYRVWQATDGEAALGLISAHRPQAVLLDLLMPGVDGHEVLRRLRAAPRLRETAVIVVSAGAPVEAKVTAEITTVTRADGLTLAEFSRGLKSSLDAVLRSPETPRAPTAGRAV